MTVTCRRLAFVLWILSSHAMAENQCPAKYLQPVDEEQGTVQCKELSNTTVQWTITRPQVRKSLTEYPEITFAKGQSVIVSAYGCVNVWHDVSKTDWRDYVDPEGNGADRHYHGLIWIPGARLHRDVIPVGTAPVRIAGIAETLTQDLGSEKKPAQELTIDHPLPAIDDPPPRTISTLRLGCEGGLESHPRMCSLLGTCSTRYPNYPYPEDQDKPLNRQNHHCTREATVVITISSNPSSNSSSGRRQEPFDVVSSEVDDNGFLFAPQWAYTYGTNHLTDLEVAQKCENFRYKNWLAVYRGIDAPCTRQASFDVPRLFSECLLAPGLGELHGHVNWAPATFVGRLEFQEVSADRDADIQLRSIGDSVERFQDYRDFGNIDSILTKDSQVSREYQNALWLEFATYETTQYFKDWRAFQFDKKGAAYYEDLRRQYQDRTAIVTGLLNLDCVHDCHTELHPVYAMAVRTAKERDIMAAGDDPWLIFVRDAGNEGDCSRDEHYLDRDSYTFFLPAPQGARDQLPMVYDPSDAFHSNERGLTWSVERSLTPGKNGILLRFSFASSSPSNSCTDLHNGKMIHISGILRLNWKSQFSAQTSCNQSTIAAEQDSTQSEDKPVCLVARAAQEISCDGASGASDDFEHNQNEWAKRHEETPPLRTLSAIKDFVGKDLGLFEEVVLYNKTSQIQPNFGGRYGIIQTPLGSVEVDGAPGFSRSVRSSNGQNLSVRISDWMAGLKVQFTHQWNMFAEVKSGQIFRSASSGYASTPDFKHFHGHNTLFLAGGGIQPGSNVQAIGTRISLRISVDYIRILGTGENMVRITIGPQFQIHRKSH